MKLLQKLKCMMRPAHPKVVRQPLGGFRCMECGTSGADLHDMGYRDGGYVAPLRRLFSRANGGTIVRTSSYKEEN